ncbi:MAG: hypothetical protein PVI28_19360, partial [Gammaproteobacteria bacterium]
MIASKIRRIRILSLAIICCALWLPTHAWSHSVYGFTAPPRVITPVVDGQCDSEVEYLDSNVIPILYRPRFDFTAARVLLLSNSFASLVGGGALVISDNLHVCVVGLPFGTGTGEPSVSLAFDVRHEGGDAPRIDDLRFTLFQSGTTTAERGTKTRRFAPLIGGIPWDAQVGFNFVGGSDIPFSWNAEFSIPVSRLGGRRPNSRIGFRVRHNSLRSIRDEFALPTAGIEDVPNTWADLIWATVVSDIAAP